MTIPVTLKRAQISSKRRGLDITAKSSRDWARAFAPTWAMVCGHKNYTALQNGEEPRFERYPAVTDQQYTEQYGKILDRAGAAWRELYQHGVEQGYEVTLLCHCRDDWFCHTHLLIAYATERWPERFQREPPTIYFNSKTEDAWLSNFYPAPIHTVTGEYPTAEHYFQAYKAVTREDHERIQHAESPQEAKKLGGKLKQIQTDWETHRLEVMARALNLKFTQHPELLQRLVETYPYRLVHRSPRDAYWGDGEDGRGANMQGILLEHLRRVTRAQKAGLQRECPGGHRRVHRAYELSEGQWYCAECSSAWPRENDDEGDSRAAPDEGRRVPAGAHAP